MGGLTERQVDSYIAPFFLIWRYTNEKEKLKQIKNNMFSFFSAHGV